MTTEIIPEAYLWEVAASKPDRSGQYHRSYANVTRHVVALTARKALDMVEAENAEYHVHSVTRRNRMGGGPVLIDPSVTLPAGEAQ